MSFFCPHFLFSVNNFVKHKIVLFRCKIEIEVKITQIWQKWNISKVFNLFFPFISFSPYLAALSWLHSNTLLWKFSGICFTCARLMLYRVYMWIHNGTESEREKGVEWIEKASCSWCFALTIFCFLHSLSSHRERAVPAGGESSLCWVEGKTLKRWKMEEL